MRQWARWSCTSTQWWAEGQKAQPAKLLPGRITAHAELLALQAAREQLGRFALDGCTLYSTHEPCVMCGYAIRYHRISRVVFGLASAYLGSCTSAFPVLLTTDVPPHWPPPPHVEQFML